MNDPLRMTNKAASLDKELKAMFAALEARALPDRIRCVVDQVMAPEPQPAARKAS